jgi:carbon monoxide dehydrogenase subunit G
LQSPRTGRTFNLLYKGIVPMEMTGEFRIPARRERVWEALNDPEMLKRAIPGCETIEKITDTEFTAKVIAKVGPVKATFGGKVNLSDLDPPRAYTISGEGTGGVAGFAKGSAKVNLDEEDGDATRLRYAVQAHVGGKLAQIGSRLIDATSRKMADDFFGRFVEAISPAAGNGLDAASTQSVAPAAGRPGDTAMTSPVGPETAESQAAEPEPGELAEEAVSRRLLPAVWVTVLTAVVGAVLYFFTRKDKAP